MGGIVTMTAAAAIDRTYRLSHVQLGEVNRATETYEELSGKGINVATAIHLADLPVRAVVTLSDAERSLVFDDSLIVPAAIDHPVRVNTSCIDAKGLTTKFNAPPIPLKKEEWENLMAQSLNTIEALDADWLLLSGSIPQVESTGALVPFENLLQEAQKREVKIALDTSGIALKQALQSPALLNLIKPNTHELALAVNKNLFTIGDVLEAGLELCSRGIEIVYVSMGIDGVLVLTEKEQLFAFSEAPAVVNTAGAGDASLAGFLVGLHDESATRLHQAAYYAASWGALAVSTATTLLHSLEQAPSAFVSTDIDTAKALQEPGIV